MAALLLCGVAAFMPTTHVARPLAATVTLSAQRGCAIAQQPASRQVVVTDMDETLITKKSTGYIIKFLFMYGAYIRLFFFLWIGAILIPISKFNRVFAVRVLYYMAFRGLRVDRAEKVAEEQ